MTILASEPTADPRLAPAHAHARAVGSPLKSNFAIGTTLRGGMGRRALATRTLWAALRGPRPSGNLSGGQDLASANQPPTCEMRRRLPSNFIMLVAHIASLNSGYDALKLPYAAHQGGHRPCSWLAACPEPIAAAL